MFSTSLRVESDMLLPAVLQSVLLPPILPSPVLCHRTRAPVAGVPGFCSWVESEAPDAVTKLPNGFSTSIVAFDMNAILHTTLRRAKSADDAIKLCYAKLHATLRHVPPGSAVLLAVDGPAPVAKIATQQRRRRKAYSKREAATPAKKQQVISSLAITPGTRFMQSFEAALIYFAYSELACYRARGLTFWVSGADVPGEGEIKLLGALRQIEAERAQRERARLARTAARYGASATSPAAEASRAERPRQRPGVVLVGQDGDLVLQALTLRASWQVSVLRDLPPSRDDRASVISLDNLCSNLGLGDANLGLGAANLSLGDDLGLGAANLGLGVGPAREGGGGTTLEGSAAQAAPAPDALAPPLDLIALSCLMGNDYLPKVREANFERCWGAYTALRRLPRFAGCSILALDTRSFEAPLLLGVALLIKAMHKLATAAASKLISSEGLTPSQARAATAGVGLEPERLATLAAWAAAEVDRLVEEERLEERTE